MNFYNIKGKLKFYEFFSNFILKHQQFGQQQLPEQLLSTHHEHFSQPFPVHKKQIKIKHWQNLRCKIKTYNFFPSFPSRLWNRRSRNQSHGHQDDKENAEESEEAHLEIGLVI